MRIWDFHLLIKSVSTLFIGISALFGFFAAGPHDLNLAWPLFLGVFSLVAGCSALNQFQERDVDREMGRTRNRPLPSGTVNPLVVLMCSIILICTGLMLLLVYQAASVVFVGFAGLIIYNGGYTPLKTMTPYAIFFGAVAGCLPPLMGWLSGGRGISDQTMWIGCVFAYFWQIAHFGLLLLAHPDDYTLSKTHNMYKNIGRGGVIRMIVGSMVLCLLAAWKTGVPLPAQFPWLAGSWFQWIQLVVVLVFGGVTLRGFQTQGKSVFHLWNSLLGIGMILGIFSLVLG